MNKAELNATLESISLCCTIYYMFDQQQLSQGGAGQPPKAWGVAVSLLSTTAELKVQK